MNLSTKKYSKYFSGITWVESWNSNGMSGESTGFSGKHN